MFTKLLVGVAALLMGATFVATLALYVVVWMWLAWNMVARHLGLPELDYWSMLALWMVKNLFFFRLPTREEEDARNWWKPLIGPPLLTGAVWLVT